MYHTTQVTDPNIYDRMSSPVVLNTDIIWLVLQHAAYTNHEWDHRTLGECCLVSREWYPLAKRMLFRFVVLRSRQQVRALQQTCGKHLQTGPSASSRGLQYDVPVPVDNWEVYTRILECHWMSTFRFNDIRHALALFPSLYEVRVTVHFHEPIHENGDDSPLAIPSTIRALRYTGRLDLERLNISCASHIISVISKHARLQCLQFEGVLITPHLQSPWPLQSIQVNTLLYLELQISSRLGPLSGDLFANLLYLVLHQKSKPMYRSKFLHGVFKRVKSLTWLYHCRMDSPARELRHSRLSETFPELTELRLGLRFYRLHLPAITSVLSKIPSGVISLSLFMATTLIGTGPAETQPSSFTVPTSLRYFEYGLGYYPMTHIFDHPSMIDPFLDFCKSKGVQLLASRGYDIYDFVSIPTVS